MGRDWLIMIYILTCAIVHGMYMPYSNSNHHAIHSCMQGNPHAWIEPLCSFLHLIMHASFHTACFSSWHWSVLILSKKLGRNKQCMWLWTNSLDLFLSATLITLHLQTGKIMPPWKYTIISNHIWQNVESVSIIWPQSRGQQIWHGILIDYHLSGINVSSTTVKLMHIYSLCL